VPRTMKRGVGEEGDCLNGYRTPANNIPYMGCSCMLYCEFQSL